MTAKCDPTGLKIVKLAEVIQTAPMCARWLFDEWGHRNPGSTLDHAVRTFRARANTAELPIAFVALENNKAVGTASLVVNDGSALSVGPWIAGVYVSPEMRGRGIAKSLITAVEAEGMRLGFSRVWLSAAVPAIYQKLGYVRTTATKHGEPIMYKELPLER